MRNRQQWDQEQLELQDYYTVEKILDMKEQKGKRYYLVKWLNWDIKTCTWEKESNVAHLKTLIRQFENSRKFDAKKNIHTKKLEMISEGTSPYQATSYYGHILYGDEPLRVVSVKMIEREKKREMHVEVEWEARENGFKPSNSLLKSQTLVEHCPEFIIGFMESKIRLCVKE